MYALKKIWNTCFLLGITTFVLNRKYICMEAKSAKENVNKNKLFAFRTFEAINNKKKNKTKKIRS